jgi:hypothetical protein
MVSPLIKKGQKAALAQDGPQGNSIGPTSSMMSVNQKKMKQGSAQSPGTISAQQQQLQNNHRRNLSDQVQMQQSKNKKYPNMQQKPTHMRA